MKAACASCGATDRPLLLAEGGSICGVCEVAGSEAEALDIARWTASFAPLLALGTSGVFACTGLVSFLGVVTGPLAAILALAAIVFGVRNFLVEDAEDLQRTALVLSGAIGALGGLVLLPLSALAFFSSFSRVFH